MMRWAVPLSLLALSYVLLAGYVWISYASLPAKVASHFDLAGEPNGWMSRDMCVELTLGLGVLLPGVILAMMGGAGKIPVSFVNRPHRDYWLAPERHRLALGTLRQFSLWFASLNVLFVAGLHWLVVQANTAGEHPHLSGLGIALVAGTFLIGTVIWTLLLLRHFAKIP